MSMDASVRHESSQSDLSASLKNHAEKLEDSSIHGNMSSEPAQQERSTTPKSEISPLDGMDFISGSDVSGTLNVSSLIPNSLPNNTEGVDSKKVNYTQITDSEAVCNLQTVLVEAMHIGSGAEISEKLNCTPSEPHNLLIDREIMHTEIQKLELDIDAQSKFVSSESAHDKYHDHEMGINNQRELEESVRLTDKLIIVSEDAFRNSSRIVHIEDNNCELKIDSQTQVEESEAKGPATLSDKQTSYSGNVSRNFAGSMDSEEHKHELEISQGTLEAFGEKQSPVAANESSKDFEDETRIFTLENIGTSLDDFKVSSTTENMGLQHERTACHVNHGDLESMSLSEVDYPKSDSLKPTVMDEIENASNAGVGDKEISLPLVEGNALDLPSKTDSMYDNLLHSVLPHCDANNADLLVPAEKAGIESSAQHKMGEEGVGSKKRRKSTAETPTVSARVLRSRSKDNHEDPLPSNVATEVSDAVAKKRKRKRKEMKKSPVSEFSRERKHLRYLLQRIKYEQNLIEAYSSEGWRKQSLEKLKPEKELQRAKSHILRYKLKIRDLFQRLDLSLTEGALPESLFDSEGEIDSEDIFCAKCGSKDVSLDNDIILCDGACERGFHQFCLEPPLKKEDIPQGDEGWLCPACDCKDDCIDFLNDFSGVKLSVLDSWEKVFPEAAAAASGKTLEDGSGLPSDDSEDDDYDPDKNEVDEELPDQETSSDDSDYRSASGSPTTPGSPAKEHLMGLPSDDSEDDDFDPNAPDDDDDDDDDQVKEKSSSDFTSDSEDLGDVLQDNTDALQDNTSRGDDQGQPNHDGEELEVRVKVNSQSLKDEISYLLNSNDSPITAKRHVERLDYKKLHDETYGNDSSDSSDEDFGENVDRKGRKNVSGRISRKGSASEGNNSDIKPHDGSQEQRGSAKRARIQFDTECGNKSSASHANSSEAGSGKTIRSKPYQRLGEDVTQRLFESFKQNQYPNRPEKEKLARDLGVTSQQVSKWFTNTRWSSRHSATIESNGSSSSSRRQTSSLQAKDTLKDEEQRALNNENNLTASPGANPAVKLTQTLDIVVEPLITEEPGEQKSGTPKSNKRKNVRDDQPQQVRRSSRLQ